MKHETDNGANVALNELLGDKPECTCSANEMTFGRCCKLKERDKAYALLLRIYSQHCGVSDGRFDNVSEGEIERSAFPGFGDFVAGFCLGIAESIKAIEESQPPETTPWDCVDAVRRKLTPDRALRATARRAIDAWDSTVLPRSRDGMMQERMEDLRATLSANA